MIEAIFVVVGLVLFFNQLFEKWGIWDWIQKEGSESNFETIFKLTSCRFCLLFHLSWIVTLIYGCFNSFGWSLLIVPFIVSGLISIFFKNGL